MEPSDNYQTGICIFCYKTTNDKSEPPGFYSNKYKGFFSLIARYLLNSKVIWEDEQEWWIKNAWRVISEFNSDNDENSNGKGFTKLVLCDNCKVITEKWCKLYDKVKQVELLMDWEISKLWNVMSYADSVEITCRNGMKILEKSGSSHELPLEDLRKTLKQSFQAYQNGQRKESFPKVSLSPVIISSDLGRYDDASSSIKLEDTGSDFFDDGEAMLDIQQDSLGDSLGETGSVQHFDLTTTTTNLTTIKRKGNFQRKRKMVKVNQNNNCPPCGKIFTEGYKLRYHQSLKHPEVFFPENYSKTAVQYTLERMMYQDFTKIRKPSGVKSSVPSRVKCGFCLRILTDWTGGKSHLILRHRKNVEENLEKFGGQIQMSEEDNEGGKGLKEIKMELKKLMREKNGKDKLKVFKCEHCSDNKLSFKDKHKLFQHEITHHIEKYFESGKILNIGEERFKEYLSYLFKITVERVWEREKKGKCEFCEVICLGRRGGKSHLILRHFQILRDKLVGLQNQFGESGPPTIGSVSGGVTKTRRKKRTIMKTTIKRKATFNQRKKKKVNLDYNCSSCGKIFRKGGELRYHQSQRHPEVFFPDNYSKTSVENVLNEMFEEHFTKLGINPDLKKEGKLNIIGLPSFRLKCGLCSKIITATSAVGKSHLIFKHMKNVEEELVKFGGKCSENENGGKSLNEIQTEVKNLNGDKSSFNCDSCPELPPFKDKHKLFQHLITHHLEKYFESGKIENIGEERFKEYLNHLFKITVENVWNRDSKRKCKFCEVICLGRRNGKSHLILKHFQILRDKLVGLQKEFGESGPPLSQMYVPVTLPTKRKGPKEKVKNTVWKCEGEEGGVGCGKVFSNNWSLQRHMSKHCEVIKNLKREKRRGIQNDLNLKDLEEEGGDFGGDGECEQSGVMVDEDFVKREDFENLQEFVILDDMEIDGDEDL